LGKTTLAHVIAKQAGYKVFEINARFVVRLKKLMLGNLRLLDVLVMLVQVQW